MPDLSAIFKAYDIRGVVPDQLDGDVARHVGAAFTAVLELSEGGAVVVGRDMRPSSLPLAAAFAEGVAGRGFDVVDIGLASTDQLYFASGKLGLPGVMFTASHNPARYNGIKLCRAGAAPVGEDSGLAEIRRLVEQDDVPGAAEHTRGGRIERGDVLADYAEYLHSLVPVSGRRLKVVVDAGNGMAGHTVPAVFADLDVELLPLYFELDGNFPNHEANPIEPENLRDLRRAVVDSGADLGLAFDGDADRCFVVDERGVVVTPSALTAMIAVRELAREPGATVIHNLITSRVVAEVVRSHGGKPVRSRVGHSFIKQTMADTGAIFGGEHSGHFYFRDFWRADSGMLAALHAMAELAASDGPMSALVAEFTPYAASGEINSTVDDLRAVMSRVESAYAGEDGTTIDHLDGLTVEHPRWWFNVRPSNTEPLLRMNVEGVDDDTMAQVRDHVLSLVRSNR
ncbi:MAG: phosphomannomutase/phosphoglucomutase [Propionibacteriales bacterium]|nr:phosphomannomutase/phosphoglucomutase [Propionibacteriales bacterium]